MADGSHKAIEDIQTGDHVIATDPETGDTRAREVEDTITGEGRKHLVTITVDLDGEHGDQTANIVATDEHPFWLPDYGRWTAAEDLKPGRWLRTSTGTWIQVTAVTSRNQRQHVHNLTVADAHTYYAGTASTSVLTHNTQVPPVPVCDLIRPGPYAVESIPARNQSQRFTQQERDAIDRIGDWFGCHSCGAVEPGAPHWTPDHQPVSRFIVPGTPQRLYPHCRSCSNRQGGLVGHMPARSGVPFVRRPSGLYVPQ